MKEKKPPQPLPVERLRALEAKAKDLGLAEELLIENASSNLCSVITSLKLGAKVLVVAGRGNNGADVLAAARKLAGRGFAVKVVIVQEKEPGPQALFQQGILTLMKTPVYVVRREEDLKTVDRFFAKSDFILEGILGIGINGEVSPFLAKVISLINNSRKKVVACDIPSGLAPDTGAGLGAAVKADYTVTFIAPKPGFFTPAGRKSCGKVFVVDIGISRESLEKAA